MLEWVWFAVLTAASFVMGRLSAKADARADARAFRARRQRPVDDNAWATAAHATMVIALYLSWPVLGLPVMEYLVRALPDRSDMLGDLTVIGIMGILGLVIVALPVLAWIIPDIARELRKQQLTH